MLLLKREFESFDGANYWVAGLSKAINTTYIPSGDSIEAVYASFLKIQLGRSFCPSGCYSSANLEMAFNENAMTFHYSSTSGTYVFLQYCFDEDMKFKCGSVECTLPDHRVGGSHYELITQLIYDNKWSKDGEAVVPLELMSLNPELEPAEFPIEAHRKVSISTKGALAVVTGITFERGLDSLKQTIELMSGESINEIGLLDGRRLELCKASILKKCPFLLDVKPSLVTRDNYLDALNGVINLVGETIKVDKIAL